MREVRWGRRPFRRLYPEEYYDAWEENGENRYGALCPYCENEYHCFNADDPKDGQREWDKRDNWHEDRHGRGEPEWHPGFEPKASAEESKHEAGTDSEEQVKRGVPRARAHSPLIKRRKAEDFPVSAIDGMIRSAQEFGMLATGEPEPAEPGGCREAAAGLAGRGSGRLRLMAGKEVVRGPVGFGFGLLGTVM